MLPTHTRSPLGPTERLAHGIPELAFLISTDSDFAIFRSFSELSARNLLYMQNELTHVDSELHSLERPRTHNVTYEEHISGTARRAELLARLVPLMERYHTALVLREKVQRMNAPRDAMAKTYDHWTHRALCGKSVGGLPPTDSEVLDTEERYWRLRDYVLLKPADRADSVAERFTRRNLGWLFRECPPVPRHWSVYYYSRNRVEVLKDWLAFPLACVFLVAPALLFHYVCDPDQRLIIMLAFIIGLAALVQVVLGTTRKQTLGVALAYMGVMSLAMGSGMETKRCSTVL